MIGPFSRTLTRFSWKAFHHQSLLNSETPLSRLNANALTATLLNRQGQWASISTSKKEGGGGGDSAAAGATASTDAGDQVQPETPKLEPLPKKYWVSYGFDFEDEERDRNAANLIFFSTVSVVSCLFAFLCIYQPDGKWIKWSQREAHIELARREALGLPLIDPDLVPPSKINLPTDEELGNFEIVV